MSAIARAADVPFTTIQSFMQGANDCRVVNAAKIAKAVGHELRIVKIKSKAGA